MNVFGGLRCDIPGRSTFPEYFIRSPGPAARYEVPGVRSIRYQVPGTTTGSKEHYSRGFQMPVHKNTSYLSSKQQKLTYRYFK